MKTGLIRKLLTEIRKIDLQFVFLFFLIIGLVLRIFLAVALPIWHDEAYSIWASGHSFMRVLRGIADPVHPPGYYLLIKIWGLVSDHLYWYRALSLLAFIVNAFLIKNIGEKIESKRLGVIYALLYIFSGYFLIFDWQVRMYSLVVTMIFLSLLLLYQILHAKKHHFLYLATFAFVNMTGSYLDYAYFWYFFPLFFLFLGRLFLKPTKIYVQVLLSLFVSGIGFVSIYPWIFSNFFMGISGITWMKSFLSLDFFLPYFLGSHRNFLATYVFLCLAVYGFLAKINLWRRNVFLNTLAFCSLSSGIFTYIYSWVATPLFHVRSLSVLGVLLIFLEGVGLNELWAKGRRLTALFLLLFIYINFILVILAINSGSGEFLVSFFPWKKSFSQALAGTSTIKIGMTEKLSTPLLYWGLVYTAAGKESWPSRTYYLEQIKSAKDIEGCYLMNAPDIVMYGCR